MTWQFVLAGLLVGVLVGMTGMGGGSLMTPILILLFGFNAKVAVGTDILHGAVFKSFGAVRHRMLGTVHARLACWMLIGSAPMSLIGVEVANTVGDNSMSNFQKIVGGALILGGAGFLARTFINAHSEDGPLILSVRDKLIAVAIGAFGGFIVGLTSVGSGTFFGLAMLFAYPLTAKKMVGTDMFHAAVLLWVAGISHLIHGDVDTHALRWLLVGSIPGVLIGSSLSIKVPERSLRIGFGLVLLLSGIKLVNTPEANYIIAFGLGGGALVLAWWLVREYRIRQRRLDRVHPQEAA
jgi:uncharacterized membrane protein YfcA